MQNLTTMAAKRCCSFLLATSLVCLPVVSMAQKSNTPPGPKYDPQTETKLKGTIQELKFPEKGNEKESAHFLVKNGEDTLDVVVCPKSFLDEMGVSFAKGDEIELTGSKVKQEQASLVLAREIAKGDDKLILRDSKGEPVWNWRR
jgi:hypothetical protein